jgi:hypothetical protein
LGLSFHYYIRYHWRFPHVLHDKLFSHLILSPGWQGRIVKLGNKKNKQIPLF